MKYTKEQLFKKVEEVLKDENVGAVAVYNHMHDGYGFAEVVRSVDELKEIVEKLEKSDSMCDQTSLIYLFEEDVSIAPLYKGKKYIWEHDYDEHNPYDIMRTMISEYKEPDDLIIV